MVVAKKNEVVKPEPEIVEPVVELVDTAPIDEVPYMAPKPVVESTPTRNVAQFKYVDSPFPETCTWLDAHGLDPEVVGIGGISKGGYRNLMDEDRNWPFTPREVDELWDIYQAELNAVDEEEGTIGE